ncbi:MULTISPECIES: helix-turn-helix domain-containing protein [Staphylococcus]|uniref:Transcriptional regulator n=1 Tax=Staphylococcus schleiferi TaxID=1295 RepID=A0A7Z7VXE6_STASC|nr:MULTISPECIES: helix-turn-helix domain-containing protein [Staphylococcus]QGS45212.1 helix-turn-helix domain-containing protein [Mammaliicoccus fleurettii]EPD52615.1 hypothetical protein HMPREF1208_00676 [Staphylococcus sp. HGB0015]MBF1992466.1 helix-turn-helix domain-containing protein [Staphylococcus schleiferi]MBF2038255.1 helix-turn-helix domain-containing protein [Staphylococcus schleiferi]MBF2099964.1 helix-turn-helix domain-containing protein [Staphylococcus schleiferi]
MKTIGEVLQSKREGLGMTLAELEKRTQIQRETLVAIERNQFEQFEHPNHIRGFIQKYAQSVNVDGPLLMDKHKEELPSMTYQAHDILQQISQNQDALVFSNTDVQPKKVAIIIGMLIGITAVLWGLLTIVL